MKIAVIHQPWNAAVPPVQVGSIAIWNYEVARRLARSHEVAAYARKDAGEPTEKVHDGVRYRRVSIFPAPHGRLMRMLQSVSRKGGTGLPEFGRAGYYGAFAARVSRGIAREGVDVIHVHNFSQFVPILRRHNPGARILLHMHCEWLTQLPSEVVRERVQQVDGIVGCSGYIARTIAERYLELAGRTGTLYNGVDVAQFFPHADERTAGRARGPMLLYVGRISPEKGLHVLLDAFRVVLQRHPESTLRIVGPDAVTPAQFLVEVTDDPVLRSLGAFYERNYFEWLRDRAELEFAGRVHFFGTVPHDRLPEHYREADILVNPSLGESFGMSLIEAGACGIPVVACDAGGMPEAVRDGETGLLVKRGDADLLAGAILRLIDDAGLRRTLGRRGVEWAAKRFGWERIAGDTLSRYETLGVSGSGK